VGHKVSVHPVDDAGFHVCHLKRYGYLRVLRYVSVDDLSHHQDQANDGQNKWNHFHLMHYMGLRGLGCEWIALAHATFLKFIWRLRIATSHRGDASLAHSAIPP